MAEKALTVDNLKISFRTRNGNVQAVRNISFDLYKGETLAIVGESGSGKSQTSRAILGILANNAIVESGRIIYNGQDLLKIDEEHMYKIRGDKIAMIFQDPMSSLNPIMRIGKQLTEAMILKNKASRKKSREEFNTLLAKICSTMNLAVANGNSEIEAENKVKCENFDKFEYKHIELETAYNRSIECAEEAIKLINNIVFLIEKQAVKNFAKVWSKIANYASLASNPFVCNDMKKIEACILDISSQVKEIVATRNYSSVVLKLNAIKEELEAGLAKDKPNFFSLGYYLTFVDPNIPVMDISEMNVMLREVLDKNFMLEFISRLEKALEFSNDVAISNSKIAINELEKFEAYISKVDFATLVQKELKLHTAGLYSSVTNTIDTLDIYNTSPAYIFKTSLEEVLNKVFAGVISNANEEKRFAKETEKYNALVEKGKKPTWKIVPKNLWDLEAVRKETVILVSEMREYLINFVNATEIDYNKRAVDIIDYLKMKASNVVYKVTAKIAKEKAIKLMEEVGIPEPEKRFRQYPFEFSGGMRQRIVIAIALAADPDILICDEPTTALDVTIQAQILELINELKVKRNLSIIFITHNLGVVANMADKIAVMYAGKIVEYGTSEEIFYDAAHPYTWALLSSMPDLDTKEKLEAIPGTPPNMIYPPVGDAFAERNKYALKIDFEKQPPFFQITETHKAATWLLHPNAPKVTPPKSVVERIEKMKKRGQGVK
jgi:oligopeptide/dipeptide ABC transporter ATP-binding protein